MNRRSPLLLLPPVVAPETVPEVAPGIPSDAASEVDAATVFVLANVSTFVPVTDLELVPVASMNTGTSFPCHGRHARFVDVWIFSS